MASGIFYGLVAALCWGVADFCARGATRSAGTFRTLLTIEVIGSVALLAFGLPTGLVHISKLSGGPFWLAICLNLVILAGAALLYRALAIGTLALVSPIAASYAAITALLSLLSGERPGATRLVGIALTLGGVILVSLVPEHPSNSKGKRTRIGPITLAAGLIEALSAMMVFGLGYWGLRYVAAPLGGVTTAFIGKVADLVLLVLLAAAAPLLTRGRLSSHGERGSYGRLEVGANGVVASFRPEFLFWIIPTALLDTGANVAYNLGVTTALTSIVSVISSLFSAVTVLLAWAFLHERLSRWQALGALAILVGIALVTI